MKLISDGPYFLLHLFILKTLLVSHYDSGSWKFAVVVFYICAFQMDCFECAFLIR
jgi:hypothetical protein